MAQCSQRFVATLSTSCMFLLPPLFHKDVSHGTHHQRALRSTEYLNGLKGLFAFIVFVDHFTLPWQKWMDVEYSLTPNPSLFQLPFIRMIYGGPTVAVFFVVSGYALSLKPLKLIRSHSWEELHQYLASTVFQRGIKLFGPPIISTLIVVILVQLGLYSTNYESMPAVIPQYPRKLPSLALQLADWFRIISIELAAPFAWENQGPAYDSHLWSIPVQYQCSLILFMLITGLSKLKPGLRMVISSLLALNCLRMERWEIFVHIMGMVISELDYYTKERGMEKPQIVPTSPNSRICSIAHEGLWIFFFAAGLYFASFPRFPSEGMYFFSTLYLLAKKSTTWHACGSVVIVFTIPHSKILIAIFTNTFLLYLGEISFAIYLVHGLVLHVLGYDLVWKLHLLVPGMSDTVHQVLFGLTGVFVFLIVIWVADIFHRTVQRAFTRASEWLKSVCWQD